MKTYKDDVRDILEPGDLILFSGKKFPSRMIQLGGWTAWSHVGIVIALDGWDTLMILESTTLSKLPDVLSGEQRSGVQMHRLSERLRTYPGSFAYRKLIGERTPDVLQSMIDFHKEFGQHPYEESYLELLRAQYDGPGGHNEEDLTSLFCSELVAELYQRMGVISDELESNEYTPKNLAKRMVEKQLINGWELGGTTRFEFEAQGE